MYLEEKCKIKGHVKIEHKTKDGVKITEVNNLILTDGFEIVADLLVGSGGTQINPSQPVITIIAAGSNNTAPSISDTDVITPIVTGGDRAATINSQPSSGLGRFVAQFGAGVATGTWRELALADTNAAKGARKCFSRVVFGDIIKSALDVITVTWELTFS